MENNKTTTISMASIGARLKDARERKSLTIDQVQKHTHIYSSILHALEEGRCDDMLTEAYVKSFLKKYAQYLALDVNEVVREYNSLHPSAPKDKPLSTTVEDLNNNDPFVKFIYIVGSVLVLTAFASVAVFAGKKVMSEFNRARLERAAAAKAAPPRKQQISIPAKKTRKAAAKTPAGKKVTQKKAAQDPITAEKIAAQKPSAAEAVIPDGVPISLTIKFKQSCLTSVKQDGELLFRRIIPKGAVESFKAQDRLEIYVAKAEAVELTLNGKSLGSPGKGVVKNIEITRKGVRIK